MRMVNFVFFRWFSPGLGQEWSVLWCEGREEYCWCVKTPSDITDPNCLPCLCINGRKMIIYLLQIPTLPTTTGVKFYYLHLQFFTSKLSQADSHIQRAFSTNDSYFILEIPCGICKTKYISILRYLKDYLLSLALSVV